MPGRPRCCLLSLRDPILRRAVESKCFPGLRGWEGGGRVQGAGAGHWRLQLGALHWVTPSGGGHEILEGP